MNEQEQKLKEALDDQNIDVVPFTHKDRLVGLVTLTFVVLNFLLIIISIVGLLW